MVFAVCPANVQTYKDPGLKRKSENPRPIYQSIWQRLETSGGTVYNTVQFCAGKRDKELKTNRNGTMFNKTRQHIMYADDVLIIL